MGCALLGCPFLLSCSPLAAAAAVGFRGSCCLPCAAAWRAARLPASWLLWVLALFASRLALTASFWQWWFFCVGGFPLLGVDVLVSPMSILVLSFSFSFVLFCCAFYLENSVSESVLVKFGSNKNFGLERGALHSLRDGHGVGSVELSGTRSADQAA